MTIPKGSLQVFSVHTEQQAERLLVASCERNLNGQFVARELATEQTIDNLFMFGERLRKMAKLINLFGDNKNE